MGTDEQKLFPDKEPPKKIADVLRQMEQATGDAPTGQKQLEKLKDILSQVDSQAPGSLKPIETLGIPPQPPAETPLLAPASLNANVEKLQKLIEEEKKKPKSSPYG